MPKTVSPDRPIWPPLPTETDRRPEDISGSAEPVEADGSQPAGGADAGGTLQG